MATRSEHWVTEPNGYLEPIMTYGIEGGFGTQAPITVVKRFAETAAKYPTSNAMALKRPVVSNIYIYIFFLSIFIIVLLFFIYFILGWCIT
jgi:hypothetical protein